MIESRLRTRSKLFLTDYMTVKNHRREELTMLKISNDSKSIIVVLFIAAMIVLSFPEMNSQKSQIFNSAEKTIIVMSDNSRIPMLPLSNRDLSESFENSLQQNLSRIQLVRSSGFNSFGLLLSLLFLGLFLILCYHGAVKGLCNGTYSQKCIIEYIYNISSLG